MPAVTIVSTGTTAVHRATATARSAQVASHVLDLDGSYVAVGSELVLSPPDVGLSLREVSVRRVVLDDDQVERWAQAALARHVLRTEGAVVAVKPGVVFVGDPSELLSLAAEHGVVVVGRGGRGDGLWPAPEHAATLGAHSPAMIGLGRGAEPFLDTWLDLGDIPDERWLDVALSRHRHHVVDDGCLVSAWSTTVDLSSAVAVDLSSLDLDAPWLLDPRATSTPRVRISDHRDVADLVASYAGVASATPAEDPVQPLLASVVSAAVDAGEPVETVPSLFDPADADQLDQWLRTSPPRGGDFGLGRLLAEVYRSRPDLQAAFPHVAAGRHDEFVAWSRSVDTRELATAAAPKPPTVVRRDDGLNVVGYLSGELGIGESARLMLSALSAGEVPHATVAVTKNLRSRQTASYRASTSDALFDTTLLCVNAKETQTVSASVASVVKGTYRIGMWYWETEDFPASQHKGLRHVDEIWVATDFIRAAVEPHAKVPVRTITPPLPQPGEPVDQAAARRRMGLPDRPILLFAFDYASIGERKNPWGLVDAYERAFAPGEGPLLVVKSISGDRNPAQAERLRLRVGASTDIRLVEDYLDADDRDALMAACDCYVSLHRSEGLGLTMAEAMAMGKPVIATAYGGNLQFMTDANSYLVPWSPIAIPAGSGPYSPGAVWADPDLDAAASAMREVFADLDLARRRGRQAMDDLRTRHSPEVAARAIVGRLDEIRAARAATTAGSAPGATSRLRSAARRTLGR